LQRANIKTVAVLPFFLERVMWVLILTIITTEAPAVTSVPGFSSELTCKSAGTTWLKTADPDRRHVKLSFVCVSTAL